MINNKLKEIKHNKTSLSYLTIGWWNTSLSAPKKQQKASIEKMELAKHIVKKLATIGVDFLGLAEVNDDDIEQLNSAISELGYKYRYITGTQKVGRTHFDLGFLYNPQKLNPIDEKKSLTARWADTHTLKVAIKINILPTIGNKPFTIFASHWPSHLTPNGGIVRREQLGRELRLSINDILSNNKEQTPYIIVMGDFNDEPFDKSLSLNLWATRDRGILSRKKNLLYNPFWKHLGEKHTFNGHNPSLTDNFCGTCFYKHGDITRWKTFDQIMFSSSFITSNEWLLDERFSSIWYESPLISTLFQEYEFDHFPIISSVVFKPTKEQ